MVLSNKIIIFTPLNQTNQTDKNIKAMTKEEYRKNFEAKKNELETNLAEKVLNVTGMPFKVEIRSYTVDFNLIDKNGVVASYGNKFWVNCEKTDEGWKARFNNGIVNSVTTGSIEAHMYVAFGMAAINTVLSDDIIGAVVSLENLMFSSLND